MLGCMDCLFLFWLKGQLFTMKDPSASLFYQQTHQKP